MNQLVVKDTPLLVLPSLALEIGLNEAMMLQQIHYWLCKSDNWVEGKKWVYNTYQEWNRQLPFWSLNTVKRTVRALEDMGYLISNRFNYSKMDQTKWYTINYEKLAGLEKGLAEAHSGPSQVHHDVLSDEKRDAQGLSVGQAIPEITTETTTEKKDILPVREIIEYLNQKTNAAYKPTTRKNQEFIRARFREGFTLEDFKKVIDLKASEWLNDPHWSKFLRPETLFGTKFESYLNQKPGKKKWRREEFDLHD
ncbi:conserved phage C-terminal domain-containing protein [Peribacillus glennii]|uniref:Replication protein n=1 Tax=Peribacillus glennii TaxID=2303991 RepID=A0A372L7X2_9BACI|nr:conserved phage C-terminal domain-containing protein [Peribacillus glennii]RFU61092.1 replication protein [Peribacillus glennii]